MISTPALAKKAEKSNPQDTHRCMSSVQRTKNQKTEYLKVNISTKQEGRFHGGTINSVLTITVLPSRTRIPQPYSLMLSLSPYPQSDAHPLMNSG